MLSAKAITVRYGDRLVLDDLSVEIDAGEQCAVVGRSGSGKTTLLLVLAGLLRPASGTVDRQVRRDEVVYVPQAPSLVPELTAKQNAALGLRVRGVPPDVADAAARQQLRALGLDDADDALPAELSGGMQQRVALARALAIGPRLLLADEPTGELDAGSARLVYGTIGELIRAERCTAVIVSHDPESASIADRVIQIRDGRVSEESGGSLREESIVVGRGGWLRLPEELLRRSGIRTHASARLAGREIVVSGEESAESAPTVETFERSHETKPVAALRRVSKSYGARTVLDGLAAMFASSTLTAVTGPSGSGKTTLLHVLAGLELPETGEVDVLGTDVAQLDRTGRAEFRRDHVGYVGQQPGLVPALSALENVELALALRGLPADAARETLFAVGLEDRIEQRVARLSTGERGRVAIARALAPRPELLLADEPTSRLDQANAIAVGTLFVRLAREFGAAVVCATHDPLLIEQADETLRLG
jgi:ABC-type lipoprotein export system ATPase subunit